MPTDSHAPPPQTPQEQPARRVTADAPTLPGKPPSGAHGGRPKGRYGRGYIPNTKEERARIPTAKHLLGAPARLPSQARWDDCIVIKDQAGTSSCVGQADSQALRARLLKVTGYPAGDTTHVPVFSALGVYGLARILDRASRSERLVDMGCRPVRAVDAMTVYGVPHEDTWPFDEGKVNEDLPLDVLEDASGFEVTGHYALDSDGTQRIRDLQHALSEGYFPVFGTEVDQAFEDTSGDEPVRPAAAQTLGGHMMMFCGYDTLPSGVVVFRGVNSWGNGWGDHGFYNASEEFVMDPRLGDITVITLGPTNPALDAQGRPTKRSAARLAKAA